MEELIPAKFIVRRALGENDLLVLNADDPGCVEYAASLDQQLAWFSLDADHPLVKKTVADRGLACWLEDGALVASQGGSTRTVTQVGQVPASRGGAARYNIGNALAATAIAIAIGISDDAIRAGLTAFKGDESDNPGRGNWFEHEISTPEGSGTVRMLVDFAHNEHGMLALADAVRYMTADRVVLLMGQAGDRLDKDIGDLVRAACKMQPARLLVAELPGYERGRKPFEVQAMIRRDAIEAGVPENAIELFESPVSATESALEHARPGDLLVLLALTQRAETLELIHRFIKKSDADDG